MQGKAKLHYSIRAAVLTVFSLGGSHNLNDILLPQFQQAFTLTNFRLA